MTSALTDVTSAKSVVSSAQTDVSFDRTVVTSGPDRCDFGSHNPQDPQETPPIRNAMVWGEVELILNEFGIVLAHETALSARELKTSSGESRCPADVKRLVDVAKRAKLGPGLVRLILQGRKDWPAAAEQAAAAAPDQSKSTWMDRKRKDTEASRIEFAIVQAGRKAGATDEQIEAAIRRN